MRIRIYTQGKIQGFGNQHSMDLKQINYSSTFNQGGFTKPTPPPRPPTPARTSNFERDNSANWGPGGYGGGGVMGVSYILY